MDRLIECVPNFSEGRDIEVLAAIADALGGERGASLLDRTADADHGRSVFTIAGDPDAVVSAMLAGAEVAIDRIDMRSQQGQHPRVGAVDVVPFIPLGSSSLEESASVARGFASALADRHDVPVYLYAAAADDSDRRRLARIRRHGFEGLAGAMAAAADAPDLGPSRPHPSAGAVAVGARPVLIAWNIQIDSRDIDLARRMAAAIRERDGGLPAVQALGLELASLACVQLSMNLLDYAKTPMWRVWETANALADEFGVDVIDSELIGLLPQAAVDAVADHIGAPTALGPEAGRAAAGDWLRIRDFDPAMTIEARLAAARGASDGR